MSLQLSVIYMTIFVKFSKENLEQGIRAYGIIEMDDEIAQFTGCWQRIEILGLKVRFSISTWKIVLHFLFY